MKKKFFSLAALSFLFVLLSSTVSQAKQDQEEEIFYPKHIVVAELQKALDGLNNRLGENDGELKLQVRHFHQDKSNKDLVEKEEEIYRKSLELLVASWRQEFEKTLDGGNVEFVPSGLMLLMPDVYEDFYQNPEDINYKKQLLSRFFSLNPVIRLTSYSEEPQVVFFLNSVKPGLTIEIVNVNPEYPFFKISNIWDGQKMEIKEYLNREQLEKERQVVASRALSVQTEINELTSLTDKATQAVKDHFEKEISEPICDDINKDCAKELAVLNFELQRLNALVASYTQSLAPPPAKTEGSKSGH